MRSAASLGLLVLASLCWLAAGPAGGTIREVLACQHHARHHAHPGHSAPTDGPCFCDQMTGGSDLAVAEAMPARPAVPAVSVVLVAISVYASPFRLPASPAFAPASPPPIGLG
ncbi:MAG TPA: hypothetical protein VFD76_07925 [Gemmatimonadales bacterium]|nr:hypothetical protein [Gemmatimonadales bacterium]